MKKPLSLAGLLLIPSLAAAQPWSAGLNDAVLRSTDKTGELHFQKVNMASTDRDMIALVKKTAPAVVMILVKGKPQPVATNPGGEHDGEQGSDDERKAMEEFFKEFLKKRQEQHGEPQAQPQAGPGIRQLPPMRRSESSGSGVILSFGGHKIIATNAHVVSDAGAGARVELVFDDRSKGAGTVLGYNEKYDLAFIEPDSICASCRVLPLGGGASLQRGQAVVAVGSPFTLDGTVTTGIVSYKGRDINENGMVSDYIQIDAAVNPGNSGGALVDRHGRLVGINTAIYSPSGAFAGIAFAIPSEYIPRLLKRFLRSGVMSPSIMGLVVGRMPKKGEDDQFIRDADGQVVVGPLSVAQDPKDGSPAAKAGFKAGDQIVSVDGRLVTSAQEYVRIVSDKVPGEKVVVVVRRGDETLTLTSDVAPLHD